jgi:hypothetical protein
VAKGTTKLLLWHLLAWVIHSESFTISINSNNK